VRTVEVELEFETPHPQPPKAGTRSFCPSTESIPEHFQASQPSPQRQRIIAFE
jgi:hypothetical protein